MKVHEVNNARFLSYCCLDFQSLIEDFEGLFYDEIDDDNRIELNLYPSVVGTDGAFFQVSYCPFCGTPINE